MKSFVIFLIVSLSLFAAPPAGDGVINGKIYLKDTGSALTGVLVKAYSEDKEYSAYTDRYGMYKIALPPGKYSLSCTYFSIQDTLLENIQIHSDIASNLDIALAGDLSSEKYERTIRSDRYSGGGLGFKSIDKKSAPKPEGVMEDFTTDLHEYRGSGATGAVEESVERSDSPLMMITSGAEAPPPDGDDGIGLPKSTSAPGIQAGVAGILTSGEVNDFRKWDLWQDIGESDLKEYRSSWSMTPDERYSVQVTTKAGSPVIDAEVQLVSANREIVWAGKTDNTGKAELWANLFGEGNQSGGYNITVNYAGKTETIGDVKKFHDGINIVTIDAQCSLPKKVDILFTVDATGSMGDEINYLKAELSDIIGKIQQKHGNLEINLGSIFYRDVTDEYIVRKSLLSKDIKQTIDFINEQSAAGGGDFEEAVEMALQTAMNEFNWSDDAVARMLFLILDAPPHNNPAVKAKLKELTAKAALMGIRLIPVTCSGIDKSTEYLMRSMALGTNGTYVFLTNHSGVGDKHIEPTTDKYDVELLNDLFIRLIAQFTVTPECNVENPLANTDIDNNIFNHDEKNLDEKDPDYTEIADRVKCYPNPTNGDLNIEIAGEIQEMYIVDITGKIMLKLDSLSEGKHQVYMGSFSTGIYFIKFLAADTWMTHKVMLMR